MRNSTSSTEDDFRQSTRVTPRPSAVNTIGLFMPNPIKRTIFHIFHQHPNYKLNPLKTMTYLGMIIESLKNLAELDISLEAKRYGKVG